MPKPIRCSPQYHNATCRIRLQDPRLKRGERVKERKRRPPFQTLMVHRFHNVPSRLSRMHLDILGCSLGGFSVTTYDQSKGTTNGASVADPEILFPYTPTTEPASEGWGTKCVANRILLHQACNGKKRKEKRRGIVTAANGMVCAKYKSISLEPRRLGSARTDSSVEPKREKKSSLVTMYFAADRFDCRMGLHKTSSRFGMVFRELSICLLPFLSLTCQLCAFCTAFPCPDVFLGGCVVVEELLVIPADNQRNTKSSKKLAADEQYRT